MLLRKQTVYIPGMQTYVVRDVRLAWREYGVQYGYAVPLYGAPVLVVRVIGEDTWSLA